MTLQTARHNLAARLPSENILVVLRDTLLANTSWQGLKLGDCQDYIELINIHKEFLPRAHMETNPRYKQIIPYLIFKHDDRYFLMQRQSQASEQRLKNKYSLGIGGHIRQEDLVDSVSIFDWAKREFHEEVEYRGALKIKPIGILNDDSNEVGQVHIGLVLLLEGDSPAIRVKSELKSGILLTHKECTAYYDSMESWTQMVFKQLE
jgi:predicted NUDIX family phosphoesterase